MSVGVVTLLADFSGELSNTDVVKRFTDFRRETGDVTERDEQVIPIAILIDNRDDDAIVMLRCFN